MKLNIEEFIRVYTLQLDGRMYPTIHIFKAADVINSLTVIPVNSPKDLDLLCGTSHSV